METLVTGAVAWLVFITRCCADLGDVTETPQVFIKTFAVFYTMRMMITFAHFHAFTVVSIYFFCFRHIFSVITMVLRGHHCPTVLATSLLLDRSHLKGGGGGLLTEVLWGLKL